MKGIFYLAIIMFMFLLLNPVFAIEYNEYKKGDTIEYNGIEFYVLMDSEKDSDIVTAIKKEPLTVNEVNSYKNVGHINVNTHVSAGDAYDMNGYGALSFYSNGDRCGYYFDNVSTEVELYNYINNYENCALIYDYIVGSSDIKYIIDAWVHDKISLNDLKNDEYGSKYRLLNNNDLINLGYTMDNNNKYNKTNKVPKFIYNDKYSYWISHSYEYEDKVSVNTTGNPLIKTIDKSYINTNGEVVEIDNNFSTRNENFFDMHTLRPLLNFKKKALKSESELKLFQSESFKAGDMVEYKGIKYYVIKDISKDSTTLTLLKATPLTVGSVKSFMEN